MLAKGTQHLQIIEKNNFKFYGSEAAQLQGQRLLEASHGYPQPFNPIQHSLNYRSYKQSCLQPIQLLTSLLNSITLNYGLKAVTDNAQRITMDIFQQNFICRTLVEGQICTTLAHFGQAGKRC